MTRRYQTKYSDNWSARSGYVNQSNPWARLERVKEEPHPLVGTLVTAFGLSGIIAGCLFMKGIL